MSEGVTNVPDIVQVVWVDSYGLETDWHSLPYKPSTRVLSSCGYLVAEDDEYIVVATTYDNEAEVFGNGTAILKCCLLSRVTVTT